MSDDRLDVSKSADAWRLLELCERAADGKLTEEERVFLEETLKGNEGARRLFAKSLHQRAELRYDQSWAKEKGSELPSVEESAQPGERWRWVAVVLVGLVAMGAGGFWLANGMEKSKGLKVATLSRTINSKWGGSTLPTVEGSRMGVGRLEILEGMAVIGFDSGAEVVMEAPATLEVVDGRRCRLERGTLVVEVPEKALGFTVETPQATVVDFGTKFGVSAGEDGKYLVKVLEGSVEVTPKNGDAVRRLKGGQSMDTGLRRSQLNPQPDEQESYRWQPNLILDAGDGWQVISTAYGRGKDSYIQSQTNNRNFGRDPFFRVKHSGIVPNLDRKGYVGFDLDRFDKEMIEDAELVLTIEPSDLGFATLVPDSTFSVYGVTAEAEDEWEEGELTWQKAPAHDANQKALNQPDMLRVVKLGEFKVAQGGVGTRLLRNQALVDFLKADTNGLVTFIICRETAEVDRDGLVHAFATKESRNNTPPLLRVKLKG